MTREQKERYRKGKKKEGKRLSSKKRDKRNGTKGITTESRKGKSKK
jgi:hypothetical protein